MFAKTLALIGITLILLSLAIFIFFSVASRSLAATAPGAESAVMPGAATATSLPHAVETPSVAASAGTPIWTPSPTAVRPTATPTLLPTWTPIPTATATSLVAEGGASALATPTPTPRDGLPVTGGVLVPAAPTVLFDAEADLPQDTKTDQSYFVEVTLVQKDCGLPAPTPGAGAGPQPTETPPRARFFAWLAPRRATAQRDTRRAKVAIPDFGQEYKSYAVAKLSYSKSAFEVDGPTPRERQWLDPCGITWNWIITPRQPGQHAVIVVVEAEWEPIDENTQKQEPYTVWSELYHINVAEPPMVVSGQLQILPFLGVALGTAFNAPFIFEVMQTRKERDKGTANGGKGAP